jgi:ribosomal protein S15
MFGKSLISRLYTLSVLKSKISSRISANHLISEISKESERPLSLATANQKQILHDKVYKAIEKFRKFDGDCGSTAVQIAVMTQRILSLTRHFSSHRHDFHSKRGFEVIIDINYMFEFYNKYKLLLFFC